MARQSLSPKRAAERMRQYRAAVITIARYRARRRVQEQIRAKGLKVAHFSAREITEQAEAYLAKHREELITKATADCLTFPEFAGLDIASVRIPSGNRTLPSDSHDNLGTNQQ